MGGEKHLFGSFARPHLTQMHWVASFEELTTAGLTKRQILRLVDAGWLHRRHHGVYAVGRPELSFLGACRAAVLACGEGAAISHITAARLWGFRTSTGRIHVSGPRSLDGRPNLNVHRPRSLPLADIRERDGIRVTSVARTLLDMAPGTPVEEIGRWIHEADVQGVVDLRDIWACCERQRHHRGRTRLLAALELEVDFTRSGLERAFLPLARRAGLPKPLVNSLQEGEEVDFCWPRLGLIVEVDGGRYHRSRWRRRRDAAKDERFRAAGWEVLRVPELQITLAPDDLVAHLATLGRAKAPMRFLWRPSG